MRRNLLRNAHLDFLENAYLEPLLATNSFGLNPLLPAWEFSVVLHHVLFRRVHALFPCARLGRAERVRKRARIPRRASRSVSGPHYEPHLHPSGRPYHSGRFYGFTSVSLPPQARSISGYTIIENWLPTQLSF